MEHPPEQVKKSVIIIGILLAVLLPVVALVLPGLLYLSGIGHAYLSKAVLFLLSRIFLWLCLPVVYFHAVKKEQQPFLRWPEKKYHFWFYVQWVFAIIGILYIVLIFLGIVFHLTGIKLTRSASMVQMIQVFRQYPALMYFTVITAGITEELLFRAYVLTRLQLLFNNITLSVIVSSVLFGLIHLGYGTLQNVLGPVLIGAVFAAHYYRYRNLLVVAMAHFLYDLIVISVSMYTHIHPVVK